MSDRTGTRLRWDDLEPHEQQLLASLRDTGRIDGGAQPIAGRVLAEWVRTISLEAATELSLTCVDLAIDGSVRLGAVGTESRRIGLCFQRCTCSGALFFDNAWLTHLQIFESRLHAVAARGARVRGGVTVIDLRPYDEARGVAVTFYGARIDGACAVRGGHLAFREPDHTRLFSDEVWGTDPIRVALNLGACRIEGELSVTAQPTPADPQPIRLDNGVSLQGAIVGGAVIVEGARLGPQLSENRRVAIDGREARSGSGFFVRETDVQGQVALRGCDLTGDLEFTRVNLTTVVGNAEATSLDADYATIGGDFRILDAVVCNGVRLRGSRVGHVFSVSNSSVTLQQPERLEATIDAELARIGDDVRLGLDRAEDLRIKASSLAGIIRLDGAVIRGDLEFRRHCLSHAGPVPTVKLSLQRAQIGRFIATELESTENLSVDLTWAKAQIVAGDESFWGDHRGCCIVDGFEYQGLEFRRHLPDGDDVKVILDPVADVREWLMRRYERPDVTFNFQPFHQLAKVFSGAGKEEPARDVLFDGWRIERKNRRLRARLFPWVYDRFFGFGYGWGRALSLLGAYWLIGTLAVRYANNAGMLVIDATPVAGAVYPLSDAPVSAAAPAPRFVPGIYASGQPTPPRGVKCGDEIEPALYAADVMIPLLDLRQEARCSVDEQHRVWWYGKALYALFGWILTSLATLTFAGVLERKLE